MLSVFDGGKRIDVGSITDLDLVTEFSPVDLCPTRVENILEPTQDVFSWLGCGGGEVHVVRAIHVRHVVEKLIV